MLACCLNVNLTTFCWRGCSLCCVQGQISACCTGLAAALLHWLLEHLFPFQARRLVKNSIIAVEAPDEDMADGDYVEDQEEADEVLARHRRPASAAAGLKQMHPPKSVCGRA